jgi:hypothetical protein
MFLQLRFVCNEIRYLLRQVGAVVKKDTKICFFSSQLREEDTKFLQEERQAFELELRSYSGEKPHIFFSLLWTELPVVEFVCFAFKPFNLTSDQKKKVLYIFLATPFFMSSIYMTLWIRTQRASCLTT